MQKVLLFKWSVLAHRVELSHFSGMLKLSKSASNFLFSMWCVFLELSCAIWWRNLHSYQTAVLIVQAEGRGAKRAPLCTHSPFSSPPSLALPSSPSPLPSTRASCVTALICMPVGEGQRVFVMQRLAVGGREGRREGRREEETEGKEEGVGSRTLQDIRSLHLPFPTSPHPDTSLAAGEAQNTKEKPWGTHCWGCWPPWCARWLPALISRLWMTSTWIR